LCLRHGVGVTRLGSGGVLSGKSRVEVRGRGVIVEERSVGVRGCG